MYENIFLGKLSKVAIDKPHHIIYNIYVIKVEPIPNLRRKFMSICKNEFISELTRIFKENGMGKLLNMDKCEKLYFLTERLLEENEKYNLTAITAPAEIILNHYCDSATLSELLPEGAKLIDIGCGAGFPTLPLAVLREDLKITALDSTAKRVNYVKESAQLLGLGSVNAVCMRAEVGCTLPEYREKFDFATARAVAEMRILAELTLPYVKIGGKLIAMKGKNAEYELSSAARAIAMLGGKHKTTRNVTLIGEKGEIYNHPLVIVDKVHKTPAAYPRAYAQISKKPL